MQGFRYSIIEKRQLHITADKDYDREDNLQLVRDGLHALYVILARYEYVPHM